MISYHHGHKLLRYGLDLPSGIQITYGNDHATGMWLQVEGDQPKVQENDSAEVRKIIQQVPEYQIRTGGVEGGFDLHTGPGGFGQRVSKEMMAFFMRRYNVPENHIAELMPLTYWTPAEAEAHFASMGLRYNAQNEQFY